MSERRPPRVVDLGAPTPRSEEPEAGPRPTRPPRALRLDSVRIEDDAFAVPLEVPVDAPRPRRRGLAWGTVAVSAVLGLIGLAVGLWIEGLVAELFALAPAAGVFALALLALLLVAALAIAIRELRALRSLDTRYALHERARTAITKRNDGEAQRIVDEIVTLFADRPTLAGGRRELRDARDDVMDASDRIALADRALLSPLDREAQRLVAGSAKRVSVVTAVAPHALIDVAFVLLEASRLVRSIAVLYGMRPGRLGFLRLSRDVIGHLTVTGAIAVGDSIAGEALGHGVASKVSRRFGEGLLNGLMTARVGISAMDLCRPLPFPEGKRPNVRSVVRSAGLDQADAKPD